MLLPYGVEQDVLIKKGMVYTKGAYGKKAYKERVSQASLIPIFRKGYYGEFYRNSYGLFDTWTNLMYQYKNILNASNLDEDELADVVDGDIEGEFYKNLDSFAKKETAYRKYVYDTYTKVPDEISPELRKKLNGILENELDINIQKVQYNEKFVDFSNDEKIMNNLYYITEFLRNYAYYSLEPGSTPVDKDFIDYFLFENGKGYCTYFATAATIMLRLRGIPARYVEGYKITSEDFQRLSSKTEMDGTAASKIEVSDKEAHAWTEVYLNGCGWIPVEVTLGRGTSGSIQVIGENTNKETASKEPVKPSLMPSKSMPQESQAAVKPSESVKKAVQQNNTMGKQKVHIIAVRMLLVITFLLAAVVAVYIRIWFIKRHKCKQEKQEPNKRVKYYYAEVDRLTRCYCKDRDKELRECIGQIALKYEDVTEEQMREFITIVEKAAFSRHTVTDVECARCRYVYQAVRMEMYRKSSYVQRIYYEVCGVF